MIQYQTSRRGGIQDFMCPFTDMFITQGANGAYSHKGTMANDVRGSVVGIRYPYYAPCDVKCIWVYPKSGQACWQSIDKVRFANGKIDYATFMTAHDDSFNAKIGQIVKQGEQLGNMGKNGNATGVHCHIEISQTKCDMSSWHKNKYGIWCFDNESDTDESYFVDNTNIIYGMGGSWKKTIDVPVQSEKYINLSPEFIEERNIYDINTRNILPKTLKVKKFGGLTYKIIDIIDNYAKIKTCDFGEVLVKITDKTPITDVPTYNHGNY